MKADQIKRPLLVMAWGLIAIFFIISLAGIIYSPLAEWSAKIANRNYNGEGLIEYLEALCWFAAALIYAKTTVMAFMYKTEKLPKLAYLLFVIFCIVALGEELSWGQHLFHYEVSDSVKAINKQKETNFHNLNLSVILNISRDNPAYRYFENFTRILNPLFYFICVSVWVVLPLYNRYTKWKKPKIVSALPQPALGTIIFCGINALLYLVVDKFFFDVGEIFELSLSLVALMSASDSYLEMESSAVICPTRTSLLAESQSVTVVTNNDCRD